MAKTFVLDTNVLLHDPEPLFAFGTNDIILPAAVIEEIDNQKKRLDEVGRNARVVSRMLDDLRSRGRLIEGVTLPSGGRLRIELNHQMTSALPSGWDPRKTDNRILSVAHHLKSEEKKDLLFITKDIGLRVKADILGIQAEDYNSDRTDDTEHYDGIGQVLVDAGDITKFFQDGRLETAEQFGFENQFFILKNRENPSHSALARYASRQLWPLAHGDNPVFGIKAKNKEQKFALDLLLNDRIKVVTLMGRSGTGKTLLALAVGLEKVMEQKAYARLLITRPVMPMGNDIGFLPGSKDEKLRPWMQPIFDNLEFLFGGEHQGPYKIVDHLLQTNMLEMEALAYIRGRSIPRQYIICDEAQNLSPHMIKTIVTRVGEGAKIVFTGDPEQIDHPYLDASSNGLSYLIEKMKDEEIAGHVTLRKGERSQVAELGARLL